jgi:hypothetical protein
MFFSRLEAEEAGQRPAGGVAENAAAFADGAMLPKGIGRPSRTLG